MNQAMRKQSVGDLAVFAIVVAAMTGGCKRADNGNPAALNAGSSGVMSKSAGLSGTAGISDAAKRANDAAGAAASMPDVAASEAPVVSTPASEASQ
ncbi:hypothetical protein LFL96_36505 (plasmid) [Paraburkholderia sp. D15]|uniref:hypothetical protein n=1 Tax=Paraburkholderia sp. D15 TaxID=2880218 RepID=UPI00247A51A5|nr:hypothetical protein [Paraburkholderia sp. D15]WGS54985.1 hypothetical protein LFL96_36505 [Paraburkholderia sp. D15]